MQPAATDALNYEQMSPRGIFGRKRRDSDADAHSAVRGRASYVPPTASKRLTYDTAGDRLLKVAVVFLCAVNAAMWEFYTESRMMAILWGTTAVAFVVWIVKDMRR